MKIVLKVLGALVLVFLLVAAGGYFWLSSASSRVLSRTFASHEVDFPVPFPLTPEEIEELGLDPADTSALERVALERAIERGRHLVSARYPCVECHGANFGGGVMIDAFPIGTLLGPNLTTGRGSRTLQYTTADWDRIVRHGILPDGTGAVMPSEDFMRMADQELSDIIAYIRSLPPVDNEVAPPVFGPVGKMLVATGQLPLSATFVEDHFADHVEVPPPAAPTPEFGRHLAATCTGCHKQDFSGGPILGGDPSWPPARNLTPHPEALGAWGLEDFLRAMRDGVRPDGTELRPPMTAILPFARNMTDVELEAIWTFLRTLPPVEPALPAAE